MGEIISNKIKCNLCGEVIESVHVHDYRRCKCGACAVDGGKEYLRRCAPNREAFEELSKVKELPDIDE